MHRGRSFVRALAALAVVAMGPGCGDDDGAPPVDASDALPSDAGLDAAPPAADSGPARRDAGPLDAGAEGGAPGTRGRLGIVINIDGDTWTSRLLALRDAGADFYTFRADWAALEETEGFLALIQFGVEWTSQQGIAVMLTIPTLDTVVRTMPADLRDRPLDDPAVLARFDALLDALLTPATVEGLAYLSLGNEVDDYLRAHPDELEGYATFVAHAVTHLRERGVLLPACVTFTSHGLLDGSPAIARLRASCDYLPVTYYPLGDDLQFLDPERAPADVAAIVEAAGDLPLVLQELGYASGEGAGGSEARQARFYELALASVAAHRDRIEATSVDWLRDGDRAGCESLVETLYLVPRSSPFFEPFVDFLCSLGLERADGTPKPAYDHFVGALATPRAR